MSLLIASRRTLLTARAAFDSDAARFFTAAGITDPTQKAAINTMVLSLKGASLWSLFYALYPIVGGNATAHAQNLISASYPITWTNAPTQSASGVAFNGTTQYGTCVGLLGNSVWPHLCGDGVYVGADSDGAGTRRQCGIANTAFGVLYTLERTAATNNRAIHGSTAGVMIAASVPVKLGHLSVHRISTTSAKYYENATEIGSYTLSDTSTPESVAPMIGAMNWNGTGATSHWAGTLSMYYKSAGMTAAQVATLTTIIEAYQDALGRGVV